MDFLWKSSTIKLWICIRARFLGPFPSAHSEASVGLFNDPEDLEALVKATQENTRMRDSLWP